ncbi:Hexuronate utilization operon transcriptional repressor ExuR [Lunatimonas lonarensis]|uniref:Hexuronate utilization operon transcriptional repressor ExuR n=1 Tax=Lunatimonas lonarensis TaxID=1232681 RepID=R7ZRL8_9BACT|nr:LacI family DNA-binding transcriptional regulator [Lunatimonas lonarensis]EON76624.1 Hexuronate utilization operon transcriptional repressor ExuR [Lunatimonas lonarensis]
MGKKEKATIHDIATKLGITASTVSRALNNHPRISAKTKKLVNEAAKEIDYKPNSFAVALRNGRSKLIGIVVPTVNRNFFSSVVRGIEEFANERDYRVIITQSYDDYEKEKQTVDALIDAQVDGILVSLGKTTSRHQHFKKAIDAGIPLIFFDRVAENLPVGQVVIDDYQASFKMTEHLIKEGYRHIAHFNSPVPVNIFKERYRGYKEALETYGLSVDPRLILHSNLQLEDGRDSARKLLDRKVPFDAIFSASDYSIVGALQELKKHGIRVPEDVGLAGFGNEPFTEFTDPPLSTVDQVSIPMGQAVAKMFFDLLENQGKALPVQQIVLSSEVIFRASTRKFS